MMGLRAAYPMHYSMNTAGRLTERGPDELSLRDIVFGGDRQKVPEGEP